MEPEVCVGRRADFRGQLTTVPLHSQAGRRHPSRLLEDASSQGR